MSDIKPKQNVCVSNLTMEETRAKIQVLERGVSKLLTKPRGVQGLWPMVWVARGADPLPQE